MDNVHVWFLGTTIIVYILHAGGLWPEDFTMRQVLSESLIVTASWCVFEAVLIHAAFYLALFLILVLLVLLVMAVIA